MSSRRVSVEALTVRVMLAVLSTSATALAPGWLAAARAKHASRLGPPDGMELLAAAASGEFDLGGGGTSGGGSFSTSWSSGAPHITFAEPTYQEMLDDEGRTPAFEAAIRARVERQPGIVVLDLGTGPFAVLALAAARAGAAKVYAIEHEPTAAAAARAAIIAAGQSATVEVVEGLSTEVTLPEKVDVVLAEILGSFASEEGCYATIADAHRRHVKQPTRRDSWIPHTSQTWGAPACFAMHHALGAPAYEWGAMGEPLRLWGHHPALRVLAPPALLEEIRFADAALPSSEAQPPVGVAEFTLTAASLDAAEAALRDALCAAGAPDDEAATLAAAAARSVSGVALWPRLLLDEDAAHDVQARGDGGEGRPSSWPTLLPLLAPRPLLVADGATLSLSADVELQPDAGAAPKYTLQGRLTTA